MDKFNFWSRNHGKKEITLASRRGFHCRNFSEDKNSASCIRDDVVKEKVYVSCFFLIYLSVYNKNEMRNDMNFLNIMKIFPPFHRFPFGVNAMLSMVDETWENYKSLPSITSHRWWDPQCRLLLCIEYIPHRNQLACNNYPIYKILSNSNTLTTNISSIRSLNIIFFASDRIASIPFSNLHHNLQSLFVYSRSCYQ